MPHNMFCFVFGLFIFDGSVLSSALSFLVGGAADEYMPSHPMYFLLYRR